MRMRARLAVLGAALLVAGPALAELPAPTAVTPELIAAAKAEAKLVWYTSMEISTAERIAKGFEAKYPGVAIQVERSGAERNFQRISQEQASGLKVADVIESSDAAHF